jgi:hypothetical protein
LRRVATLIAQSAPPAAVFEAVTREVGRLCDADLARMERYESDGFVTGVAAWSRVPATLAVGTRFALDGSSIARDVRRTGTGNQFRRRIRRDRRRSAGFEHPVVRRLPDHRSR